MTRRSNSEASSESDHDVISNGFGVAKDDDETMPKVKRPKAKTDGTDKVNITKGYADVLKPDKLTVDNTASDVDWWVRSW